MIQSALCRLLYMEGVAFAGNWMAQTKHLGRHACRTALRLVTDTRNNDEEARGFVNIVELRLSNNAHRGLELKKQSNKAPALN